MTTISTKSFQLSVSTWGNPDAPKLALLLPGFLDSKDFPHCASQAKLLVTRGYYVLSLDPPGTWGSGDDIAQYTMSNYLRAVDETIALYGNKPTLLVGQSLGGLVAALAAGHNPHIAALVSTMSPFSFIRVKHGEETAAGITLAQWREQGTRWGDRDDPADPSHKRHFEVPYSFVEDSAQYDSLKVLGSVTIPKLFIAGEHDTQITPDIVRAIYDAAADPRRVVVIDSEHDYWRHPAIIEEVTTLISEFLDKTVGKGAHMKQPVITSNTKSAHILSQGIVSNGFIFVSGQVYAKPDLTLIEGTVAEKVAQIMYNIGTVLKAADATLDNIVKVVIYVTDMSIMPELNEVYPSYFKEPYPVREAICVQALPLGATIEISVVAEKA